MDCPYFTGTLPHPLAVDDSVRCSTCARPVARCPHCQESNRVLARFCRGCGENLDSPRWSVRGGECSAPQLHAPMSLPPDLPALWSSPLEGRLTSAPLSLGELLISVSRSGELRVFHACSPDPIYAQPLTGARRVVATPALLQSLLLVADGDRLITADLVELLEVSPGSGSRKRVFNLRGEACSDLCSDGRQFAAVATTEGGQVWLHVFALDGTRLQLVWSRSPGELEGPGWVALALTEHHLVAGMPSGRLAVFSLEKGTVHRDLSTPVPLAPLPMLTRLVDGHPTVLAAGQDGSLFQLTADRLVSLAEPCDQHLFSIGASHRDLVACHGKLLRRVHLRSRRTLTLELPLHCTLEPIVVHDAAAVLSDDGTLYHLDLLDDHFQARASRRVAGGQEKLPTPAVWTGHHLFVCGSDQRLVCVGPPLA